MAALLCANHSVPAALRPALADLLRPPLAAPGWVLGGCMYVSHSRRTVGSEAVSAEESVTSSITCRPQQNISPPPIPADVGDSPRV